MSGWIVKIGGTDYPARDPEMIAEWFREQRITTGSTIFDPGRGAWLSLLDYANAQGSSVIVTTTNSLDGYRIVRYLGVEMAASDAWAIAYLGTQLDRMRNSTLDVLRARAVLHGGNAVVGITFDYMWAEAIAAILTASATIVQAEPLTG
jgi:uncharacterized protein YbjQ (UPF0145 family)